VIVDGSVRAQQCFESQYGPALDEESGDGSHGIVGNEKPVRRDVDGVELRRIDHHRVRRQPTGHAERGPKPIDLRAIELAPKVDGDEPVVTANLYQGLFHDAIV
jgi:hypothetical protein